MVEKVMKGEMRNGYGEWSCFCLGRLALTVPPRSPREPARPSR